MRMTVVMLAVSSLRQASPRNCFTAPTSGRLLTWSDRVTVKRSPEAVSRLRDLNSSPKAEDVSLPMKASPTTPIEPQFSWTEFYLGANGGGGSAWSHFRGTQTTVLGPTAFCCGFGLAGGVIGGQAGFNYEFPSH